MTKAITFTEEEIKALRGMLLGVTITDITVPDLEVNGQGVNVSIAHMNGFVPTNAHAVFDILKKLEKY